jgi:hypothetical protein
MTPTPEPTDGLHRWVQRHPVIAYMGVGVFPAMAAVIH